MSTLNMYLFVVAILNFKYPVSGSFLATLTKPLVSQANFQKAKRRKGQVLLFLGCSFVGRHRDIFGLFLGQWNISFVSQSENRMER